MCSRHEPEAGADSEPLVKWMPMRVVQEDEPVQVACGHWIERGDIEGFCALPPNHPDECLPPRYEVNDLGFNYRTDRRDVEGRLVYREDAPGDFWRNWNLTGSARFEGNFDDRLIANWLTLSCYWRHLDFWSVYARLLEQWLGVNSVPILNGDFRAGAPAIF